MRPRRRACTVPLVSVLAASGLYAVLTFYFFDLELMATLRSRRGAQLDVMQPVSLAVVFRRTYEPSDTRTEILSDDPDAASRYTSTSTSTSTMSTSTSTSSPKATTSKVLGDRTGATDQILYNASIGNRSGRLQRFPNIVSGAEPKARTHLQNDSEPVELPDECKWVNFTVQGPPYFLTVVFIVRIYDEDRSKVTTLDLKHWLIYLRYAGVEHVYLYDLWYLPGESQREHLDLFIREGFLTYEDRHHLNPYVRKKSQLPSYQHCIDEYGKDSVWQAAIDVDEYPFSSEDTEPGFMSRVVTKFSMNNRAVSEITMNNFLYLGEKNESAEYLIEKLWRHTHGPSNRLVKPIYKPAEVRKAQVHHNVRKRGVSRTASSNSLRINHYWGARLQNWGPDTDESLAMTEEDRGMEPILKTFKTCEKYFREYL